jgi:putative inorganic carbon (hco3(-)) transporter
VIRSLILAVAMLGFLPFCFRYPAAGVICWEWVSLMNPHRQVYGFASDQHFNLAIAAATLLGWVCSSERKRWTPDWMPKLMVIFLAWMTITSAFSVFPQISWFYWDRFMRALSVIILVFFIANRKARIHGLIWIIVISIGYYGVKGGIWTITSGGGDTVLGPAASMIADNNGLGLALVMTLPLVNYLRMHSKSRWLQLGLAAATFFLVVAVLGTHSRGGAVALGVVFVVFWASTRRKIFYGIAAVGIAVAALKLMPESYFARLDTLNDVNSDSSFIGRLHAWQVSWHAAVDYFPFGGGLYAPFPEWAVYFPGWGTHAAHSIYFQVLGEQGFIGLAIYLLMLVLALRNAGIVMRQTRGRSELLWAYDLANMIRVALIGYYIGGAALSLAYYDGFWLLLALLSVLREMTAPERATNPQELKLSAVPLLSADVPRRVVAPLR